MESEEVAPFWNEITAAEEVGIVAPLQIIRLSQIKWWAETEGLASPPRDGMADLHLGVTRREQGRKRGTLSVAAWGQFPICETLARASLILQFPLHSRTR